MLVKELIAALKSVGESYRNKDGSKPADAITKIITQLEGFEQCTLEDWKQRSKNKKNGRKPAGGTIDEAQLVTAQEALSETKSQVELREAIRTLDAKLSAQEWKALGRRLIGKSYTSGKTARSAVETHFSDRILMSGRIESVKRIHS